MAEREELILEIRTELDRAKSDVEDLERQLKELEDPDPIELKVDTEAAQADVKGLGEDLKAIEDQDIKLEVDTADAKLAAEDLGLEFETTEQKIRAVTTTIEALAQTVDANLRASQGAAQALGNALGPELSAKVDVDGIVADLQRMGLTTDEIRANADQLAASFRQVDGIKTQGLADGLDYTNTKMTGLRNNADQSRSVLANLAGNSAQDIGELGGVVGSLGVGIGQMAEYAVDGNIKLSQLASVAGPMLGLTIATKGVTEALSGIKAEDAFRAELVDKFTESLRDAGTVAQSLFDTLLETGELEFSEGGGGITGLAHQTSDLLPILDQARLTTEDFFRLVESQPDRDTLVTSLLTELATFGITGDDALDIAGDIADAVSQYGDAADEAAEKQRRLNEVVVLTDSAVSDAVNAFRSAQEPTEGYGATLLRIGEALQSGAIPATEDMEFVTQGLGISMSSALTMAEDYTEGLVGTGQTLQEFIDIARSGADPVAALAAAGGPLLFFFNQLVDDAKDGVININDAQDAIEQLGTAWGVTNDVVNQRIFDEATRQLEEEAEAALDAADALREYNLAGADAVRQAQQDVIEAEAEARREAADALRDYNLAGADAVRQAQAGVFEEVAAQIDEEAEAAEEAAEAQREHAEALRETSDALAETAAGLDDVALRADGVAAAFDELNQHSELTMSQEVIDFVGNLHTLHEALHEATRAGIDLNEVDLVPDSWEEITNMPEELGPVQDALVAFRQSIQSEFSQAFAQGGAPEARQWAENTRAAVTEELHRAGVESEDAVNQILSALGLLDTQVELVIDVSTAEQARAVIDDISSAIETLPTATQIEIAVLAQTDPVAALQLAIDALEAAGVEVPVSLIVLQDQFAEELANTPPPEMPVRLVPVSTYATDLARAAAGLPPAEVPVTLVPDPNQKIVASDLTSLEIKTTQDNEAFDEIDDLVDEERTAIIDTEADLSGITDIDNAVAESRTAVVDVDADISDYEREMLFVVRRRTTTVDVETGSIDMPSNSELRNRIGTVRVPIQLYYNSRIEGSRPGP